MNTFNAYAFVNELNLMLRNPNEKQVVFSLCGGDGYHSDPHLIGVMTHVFAPMGFHLLHTLMPRGNGQTGVIAGFALHSQASNQQKAEVPLVEFASILTNLIQEPADSSKLRIDVNLRAFVRDTPFFDIINQMCKGQKLVYSQAQRVVVVEEV